MNILYNCKHRKSTCMIFRVKHRQERLDSPSRSNLFWNLLGFTFFYKLYFFFFHLLWRPQVTLQPYQHNRNCRSMPLNFWMPFMLSIFERFHTASERNPKVIFILRCRLESCRVDYTGRCSIFARNRHIPCDRKAEKEYVRVSIRKWAQSIIIFLPSSIP